MADPLSVAAGVVGVLTAAAHISSLLINFSKNTKDAPNQARVVLAEVSDMFDNLSHLQSLLLGTEVTSISRTSLLKVDQVVSIVSGCVLTFSELQELLDDLNSDGMTVLDRIKWVRKESAIQGLIQRLQTHKASLSIMLAILNGHTMLEAKNSVDRLCSFVEVHYQEISTRLQALEQHELQQNRVQGYVQLPGPSKSGATTADDSHDLPASKATLATSHNPLDSGYSEDLQSSRVYRRTSAFRRSIHSFSTIDGHSMTWSNLSHLSMADVSQISLISLAITKGEVYNLLQYAANPPHNEKAFEGHAPRFPKVSSKDDQMSRVKHIITRTSKAKARLDSSDRTMKIHGSIPRVFPFEINMKHRDPTFPDEIRFRDLQRSGRKSTSRTLSRPSFELFAENDFFPAELNPGLSRSSGAIPSQPSEFAKLFPSTRRLNIVHDDTLDGNMSLRVDTEVQVADNSSVYLTLFHLKINNLDRRDFTLHRYGRDFEEICHFSQIITQREIKKIRYSTSRAFSSSKFKSSNPQTSLPRRNPGPTAEDETTDFEETGDLEVKSSTTNMTSLTFSNYGHVNVNRSRIRSKRYEYGYWGVEYYWKCVSTIADGLEKKSYRLFDKSIGSVVAHIVPDALTEAEAQAGQQKRSLVPPSTMWISDARIFPVTTDGADSVIATGPLALIDDCIRAKMRREK